MEVEDQMRLVGMCVNGGCVSPGVAEELNGRTPTDPGARWIDTGLTKADGNRLVIQALPAANPELQAFIMTNYGSATPGQLPSLFTYADAGPEGYTGMVADAAGVVSTNAGRIGATAGGATAGAYIDYRKNGADFMDSFDQHFSYAGLVTAATFGAYSNIFTTSMFNWAGVPNSIQNVTTIPGVVIRGTQLAIGQTAGKAAQAAVNSREAKKN